MFDFSFSELVVIMVVALIVIGPERLPKVARTMGLLWGRAQRYINGVRADIERDMQMEELKQLKLKVEQEAAAAAQTVSSASRTLDDHLQGLQEQESMPVEQAKPRSVPAAGTAPKEQTVPEQKQFPTD
ncbi:Sec-independent protein translocase protein TatB [Sideroxydans lithotrophicus]|uniref:Sec-independent protein translocase protein TatB n=1 Tax=Sideroxydans lithotrophicus (strain ES-1) TaxID=580332 RepID=D5CNG0_SIDLE|nr:Sec-independent protein translocase protein TatB [Sideroxydans lithotrophicus]ADE10873.1 twin-arginine translocation protein, TatB subunit [Sideroxydans lithotrophicus ES-1]